MSAFAASRAAALPRWRTCPPLAPKDPQRSFVLPGHPAVTRLSGAIRHRLALVRELPGLPLAVRSVRSVRLRRGDDLLYLPWVGAARFAHRTRVAAALSGQAAAP